MFITYTCSIVEPQKRGFWDDETENSRLERYDDRKRRPKRKLRRLLIRPAPRPRRLRKICLKYKTLRACKRKFRRRRAYRRRWNRALRRQLRRRRRRRHKRRLLRKGRRLLRDSRRYYVKYLKRRRRGFIGLRGRIITRRFLRSFRALRRVLGVRRPFIRRLWKRLLKRTLLYLSFKFRHHRTWTRIACTRRGRYKAIYRGKWRSVSLKRGYLRIKVGSRKYVTLHGVMLRYCSLIYWLGLCLVEISKLSLYKPSQ